MSRNESCFSNSNSTNPCNNENNPALGLAVGLPIFFVALLVVGIAAILWFRQRKSVNISVSDKLKTQEKSQDGNSRESPYSGYAGGLQPSPQSPVYENFQSGKCATHEFQTSNIENEDKNGAHDVYLPCDSSEAIYSNDPALYQPSTEDSEDLYIMPDV